jgi:hypothetical protein
VDEVIPVEFILPAVTLAADSDKPVVNIKLDEAVTIDEFAVTLVAVALEFQLKGGWDDGVLHVEL